MTFVLPLVYLVLTFASPVEIVPALAPLKPVLILGFLGLLASLATIPNNRLVWQSTQPLVLAGFIGMLLASRLLTGWPGGVPLAFMTFVPAAACFYMTIGMVKSVRKIQLIAASLLLVGLYFNTMAVLSFHGYIDDDRFVLVQYLKLDPAGEELEKLVRVKALGFMDDPNDFAQFLLVLLPLMWLWKGNPVWNFFSIYLPSLYLLYGVYLTRSRGALVGLAVIVMLTLRQRLGNIGSAVLTQLMVAGLLVAGFTGGRSVSIGGGTDRLSLWSEGIGMFKHSPLWGVGYQAYADYSGGLTAHNSFIQCLAETGFLGYSLWLALIIINLYYLNRLTHKSRQHLVTLKTLTAARAVALAFYAFLATSWFLSRAYIQTLYLLLGLTVVLHRITAEQNPQFVPFELPRRLPAIVVGSALASIVAFYFVVNLR